MDLAKYTDLLEGNRTLKELSRDEMIELIMLLQEADKREETRGHHNWFVPGTPYGIEKLMKHKAAMDALRLHREVLVLGGNRAGKTSLGAYVCSVLATGQYPEWWEGVRFDHPVHMWAAGKTAQTTRDTVQKALMGDVGSFGTGMIPKDCIGQISTLKGTTHALESVMVKHVSGGWSSIGFKSYKQEVQSFFGTSKHLVWLDEPCPDLIYNECLIRTAIVDGDDKYEDNDPRKGGRILHTITPKDGLTRLLADFLANCALLAGTESLPGLDIAMALMDQQKKDRGEE